MRTGRKRSNERLTPLRADLASQKADIMKGMFTVWIGQAAVTVGLILMVK
jgi:hypothetical protein